MDAYLNLRTGEAFTELFLCTKHGLREDIIATKKDNKIVFKKLVPANVGLWIDEVTPKDLLEAFNKGFIKKEYL